MIAAELLPQVLDQVVSRAQGSGDALVMHLRGSFPGVHFTVCSDDDVPARLAAVVGNAFCNLYYVSAGEHCLSFTTDAAAATGLVVALRDDET